MQKNRIELAGYLADKPKPARYLPSGTKVVNARLGESYRYKDQNNQAQEHTNWHSLVFYDRLANLAEGFQKGENIYVEGTLQTRKFTPQDGSARTVYEVIVRSCHVIAPLRSVEQSSEPASPPAVDTATEERVDGWSVA